ncbi:phytanoyl-CoA dioxygenase family protein [Xanthomonas vasicola]|uniref:phytanoyl-CoA dioxygenase family protein n=1 Tax=Xanthomonas vasicola TaxID=56459 RepID=UPI0006A087D4|nr:phytanoyl-CoA dioxygenase family protein [Xanthomonas vasicola]MBV6742385.1 phytanoyl-CoA dioxygenase family protein [Xanthomonas vasicola pv. musacearum NCPPB 2251]
MHFLKKHIQYASAFQRHGYIVLRPAFSGGALDRLRVLADFLEAAPEIAGRWMKYFERGRWGTRLLNRVEAFLEHCPEAPAVFDNPAMHDAVFAAFGRPYVLFKEKLNLKPAGGGGYAPHQDAPAWRLLTQEAVSVMVAVDETTAKNGALQVDCEFAPCFPIRTVSWWMHAPFRGRRSTCCPATRSCSARFCLTSPAPIEAGPTAAPSS